MTNETNTLARWLEAVSYRITGGDTALWSCWGPNARYIDSASKENKNEFSVCIDEDGQVLVIYAYDIVNNLAWRWFSSQDVAKAYADECVSRNCPDAAWGDAVEYTDLEVLSDILEKTRAMFLGEEYDRRVIVELDIDETTFVTIAREAHKRDITFNQMVGLLLMKEYSEIRES